MSPDVIFYAKMHKIFDFRCGSAPDPAGGVTALPQTSYLYLRGPTLRTGRGNREGWGRRGKGEGKESEGRREREEERPVPSSKIFRPRSASEY